MVNAIVDLSHHNQTPNFEAARASGLVGVMHKATQDTGYVDPTYEARRVAAISVGLRWGAYHFGTGGDPKGQAIHFLNTVQPTEKPALLALDVEIDLHGPSMSLFEAKTFLTFVHEATGVWPGLYAGHYVRELLAGRTDAVLAQCWLWWAQYGPHAVIPPCWPRWTFWQYTDGRVGPEPHTVDGIGRCDRSQFNGDLDALQRLWDGTPKDVTAPRRS